MIKELLKFRDARGWKKYHSPRELSRALMIEAAELNELYLWGDIPDIDRIKEELADVYIFAEYIRHHYGLDMNEIIKEKMIMNAKKYPAK